MRKMTMFVAALAFAAPALAVTVPATGDVTLTLPGTTSAADTSLGTTNISDTLVNFSTAPGVTPAVSGKIQVRVGMSKTTGVLIYSWRIINNATSGGPVRAFNVVGFPAATYDGNWRSDSIGTINPKTLQTANAGTTRVMGFQFDGVAPGKESHFFFLKSTAKAQDTGKAIGRIKLNNASIDIAIPKPKL